MDLRNQPGTVRRNAGRFTLMDEFKHALDGLQTVRELGLLPKECGEHEAAPEFLARAMVKERSRRE